MNHGIFPFLLLLTVFTFGQQAAVYTDTEAGKHVGEEATVTGKVFSVSTSGSGTTFLNLGGRFPQHTFGAVIFASKLADVGDVKQYEGKEVSLSGRIELSRDQKPQIILSKPDQIKLAAAAAEPAAAAKPVMPAAATPAPTPVVAPPATAPARPATSAPAAPETPIGETSGKVTGKIELPVGWNSPRRGGEAVRKDLARLFGDLGTASENTVVDASIEVYPGIPFLCALDTARKVLKLENLQTTKSKLTTPGFPFDSFYVHEITGIFPGGYNRLSLITDRNDQIVSAMLVDSSIRARVPNEPDSTGYHTYNFISGGGKGVPFLAIRHKVTPPSSPGGTLVVDTLLVDPTDPETPVPSKKGRSTAAAAKPKTGKVLERSRWFIPPHMVNLILRCIGG